MERSRRRWILPAGGAVVVGTLLLAACSTTSATTTTGMPRAPMPGSHTPGVGMAGGGMMIGGNSVPVMLTDFAVTPAVTTVRSGPVTFRIMNRGAAAHELVVLRTDVAPGSLAVTGGKATEP